MTMLNTAQMLLPAAMVGGAPVYGKRGVFIRSKGLYVSSGSVMYNVMLSSAGQVYSMYVFSRGSAISTTVNGGFVVVSNGGVIYQTVTYYPASTNIRSGGVASNDVVLDRGALYVSSGGVAYAPVVSNTGRLLVSSRGRTDEPVVLSGGTLALDGNAHSISLQKGACFNNFYFGGDRFIATVTNGSTTIADNVSMSAGSMHVSSGGVLSNIGVTEHGRICVSEGGVAESVSMIRGANAAGYVVVSSGGIVNTISIAYKGDAYVSAGGVLNNGIVESGGFLTVSSGGVTNGIVTSGNLRILTGGTANSVTIMHSTTTLNRGGVLNGVIISAGSLSLSGHVTGIVVEPAGSAHLHSGTLTVSQGSVLRNVQAGGGPGVPDQVDCLIGETAENWSGCTLGTGNTIGSGVWRFNGSSTTLTLSNNVLRNFGAEKIEERLILSGITAVNPIVRVGCRIFAHEGCVISGGTVLTDGNLSLNHSAFGYDIIVGGVGVSSATFNTLDHSEAYRVTVSEGGYVGIQDSSVVSGVSVLPGGAVRVVSNGTAVDVVVSSTGVLGVRVAGVASSVTVVTGGSVFVSSGGIANEAAVYQGGSMFVASGGIANETTVYQGGSAFVSAGGSAQDCVVSSGGRLFVRGVVNDTLIYVGSETVFSGGSSVNTVISSGYQIVSSGYTLSTVISAGSQMIRGGAAEATTATEVRAKIYVSSGGTAVYPLIMSGASMVVSSGGTAYYPHIMDGGVIVSSAGAVIIGAQYSHDDVQCPKCGSYHVEYLGPGAGYACDDCEHAWE